MAEHLTKARDCAGMAEDDLRQALSCADPIASIIIADELAAICKTRQRLELLLVSVEGLS